MTERLRRCLACGHRQPVSDELRLIRHGFYGEKRGEPAPRPAAPCGGSGGRFFVHLYEDLVLTKAHGREPAWSPPEDNWHGSEQQGWVLVDGVFKPYVVMLAGRGSS